MAVAADGTIITDNESGATSTPDNDDGIASSKSATNADTSARPDLNNGTGTQNSTKDTNFSNQASMNTSSNTASPEKTGLSGYLRTTNGRRITLIFAAAVFAALAIAVWMWSNKTSYKVLFSNFSDRDGGAIVAALSQMNVPYKYLEGGNAILVPENMVYDTRLRLASQGLPKGGNVGFELLENQKFGISQFLEQVNYQRALEGELARSIETVSSVESARVHLALPKSSVFVRNRPEATASIVLSLYGGRFLDDSQVNGIVHLVASSVPQLSPKNVTIVDQSGNLLSGNGNQISNQQQQQKLLELLEKQKLPPGLEPEQVKYVHDLQNEIVKRVESIITPIVGPGNVRAEASVDVDFTVTEQAGEYYKPNQTIETAAVRSQQSSETLDKQPTPVGGIPGALTNQPPAPAVAPIEDPLNPQQPKTGNSPTRRDATINYEVDKTVRYTPQQMQGLKRVTVAVVVNNKPVTDENGKVTMRPLTEDERNQITSLVKEAMGYNQERGDSVNVMNSLFTEPPKLPAWQQPTVVQMGLGILKYLLFGIAFLFLYFAVIKPIIWKVTGKAEAEERARREAAEAEAKAAAEANAAMAGENAFSSDDAANNPDNPDALVNLSPEAVENQQRAEYEKNLAAVKEWITKDPKLAASILTIWVNQ